MDKIDLKKALKHLYQPPAKEVVVVEVPPLNYLMLDGEGDPNTSPVYQAAVEVLFSLSYTLKFMVKKGPLAIDYGVMPLEGLWWADDMSTFTTTDKSNWKWTMMLLQPEIITPALVAEAMVKIQPKADPTVLGNVRFESLVEGTCAQIMHIGPFTAEGPTIERLHMYIAESGHQRAGKHHEIYLSDIRKADPAKWRTIIRQPMR
jgi:hypothetical protein